MIVLLWILLDQLFLSLLCCFILRLHFLLTTFAALGAFELVRLRGAPALQPTLIRLLARLDNLT